jgi:hypothetical protein
MQPSVSREELTSVSRGILRVVANAIIEISATQAVLALVNPEAVLALEPTRAAIREQWKSILDSLGESTPESIQDMLLKFEGRIQ